MGASRTLSRKISNASLEIARRNAAKPQRAVKYVHAGERLHLVLDAARRATLFKPNRESCNRPREGD